MTINAAAYPTLLSAIVVGTGSDAIRMKENTTLGGTGLATITLAHGTFFLRGDGAADDILPILVTAMNAHGNVTTPNTYETNIVFSVDPTSPTALIGIDRASGTSSFELLWDDPLTTIDKRLFGFSATTAFATSLSSDLSPSSLWVSNDIYVSLEPAPYYKRALSRAVSGKTRAVKRSGEIRDRIWVQQNVEERRMHEEAIEADAARALNTFVAAHAGGNRFEFHNTLIDSGDELVGPDASTLAGTFIFSNDFYPESGSFAARVDGCPLYSFTGKLLPYKA